MPGSFNIIGRIRMRTGCHRRLGLDVRRHLVIGVARSAMLMRGVMLHLMRTRRVMRLLGIAASDGRNYAVLVARMIQCKGMMYNLR